MKLYNLKQSGMLAIAQLVAKRALSKEYTYAFIKQIIQTVKHSDISEDSLKLRGLQVLLVIVQNQSVDKFEKAEMDCIMQMPRVAKAVIKLSEKFDASELLRIFARSIILLDDSKMMAGFEKMLKDVNLKTMYLLLKEMIEHEINTPLLEILKAADIEAFNKTVLSLIN